MVDLLFHSHARDGMLYAIALNDKAAFAGEPVPFPYVGLGAMCKKLGIINHNPHDALADCLAEAGSLPRSVADVLRRLRWDESGRTTTGTTSSGGSMSVLNSASLAIHFPSAGRPQVVHVGHHGGPRSIGMAGRNAPESWAETGNGKQAVIDELNETIDDCVQDALKPH